MKPIVQEDITGCAFASVAALTGTSYRRIKTEAKGLGIAVDDRRLWSDPAYMRRLLTHFEVKAGRRERPFTTWRALPDCALLAIKWHREPTGPAWHWTIFVREKTGDAGYVLDPKKALRTHRRTDFGRIRPKWFIEITRRA